MNEILLNPSSTSIKTKQHFKILDGLRGVAALAVVIFHFMEWIFTDYTKNFIGHGFLAVDFFFCLSGFVIAYAYDDRLEEMGVMAFFKARLIRLHPLVIFGTIIGLIGFFIDPFASYPAYGFGKLILLFLCSIFIIPLPIMEERFYNLFSFNAPAWSLFWEYVANIFYAFVLYKIGRRSLIALTIVAGLAICFISYRSGNLMGGWGKTTFFDGGVRVAYSFLAGLLIYRSQWIIKNKIGFIGLAILLSMAFVMPSFTWNWLTEAMVVLFYFPLLVSIGAGTYLSPRVEKVCEFSGKISYPLYMTHYAAIWIFGNYFTSKKPPMAELPLIIITGTILLIIVAYLVMVIYDIPFRNYLAKKWQKASL